MRILLECILVISEVWREYISDDLDLSLPSVILSTDHVSNEDVYNELIDGNLATCIVLKSISCPAALKVSVKYVLKIAMTEN